MKKYKIMFSIPVHEQLPVVIDQIINFQTLNEDCAIVLHLSQTFNLSDVDLKLLYETCESLGNIFINPQRLKTGWCSIIQAHLSNFNYVKDVDFEYFCLAASNELFFRKGLYSYIKKYDCVMYSFKTPIGTNPNDVDWSQMKKALNDIPLFDAINKYSGVNICGGQAEGSYYRKSVFQFIYESIVSFFDYNDSTLVYAREEVYFHTFCALYDEKHSCEKGLRYTYINWDSRPPLIINLNDIKKLSNNEHFYSVKRIDRTINNYLRIYFRKKYKYYKLEKLYLGTIINKREKIKSYVSRKIMSGKKMLVVIINRFTVKISNMIKSTIRK